MTDIFQRNIHQKTPSTCTSLSSPLPAPPAPQPTVIETKTPYTFDSPKSSVGFQITTPVQTTFIPAGTSPGVCDARIGVLTARVERLEIQVRDLSEGVEQRIKNAVYEAVNERDLHERRMEDDRRREEHENEPRIESEWREGRAYEKRLEDERRDALEHERRTEASRDHGNQKVWDEDDWNRRLVEEREDESSENSVVIIPERAASVCGSVIQRIEERIRETERKLR
jgi:hypothetical protein